MTWVNCTGTTDPILVGGSFNVLPLGHKLVNNSYPPVLYLNGSPAANVAYGSNNEGVAIYDGRTVTYKGLVEVTNWGSLTAGAYIGIKLPTLISPATTVLNNTLASGTAYDAAAGNMYVSRILGTHTDQVRFYFTSNLNSVTQTDAPATIYFEIEYEPYVGVI